MAEPIEIDVWQGEIAELEVDALVVATSESLFMTAGAAASVKRHGGEEIERAAVEQGPVRAGTAVATAGGALASPYVIHAVAVSHDRVADPAILAEAVRSAIAFAQPLQLRRIAVALLGVEHGAFSASEAAAVLVPTLASAAGSTGIESIVLAAAHLPEAVALGESLAALDTGAPAR